MIQRIIITPGEPAGIGPDICVAVAQNPPPDTELIIVSDPGLLKERAQQLGLTLAIDTFSATSSAKATQPGHLSLVPIPLRTPCQSGILNPENACYVLDTLKEAVALCRSEHGDAFVTGPVHKGCINEAGIPFSGHTEFLAELCGEQLTVMMLATEGLRVALVTTHLPLVDVAAAITPDRLDTIITILHRELGSKFGIANPAIVVCGLNPHAGEGGHLGREEIDIIEPVLLKKRQQGINLIGPLPADTLFTDKYLAGADAVLAMYHDQGLPVLKFKGFGRACNITLGLPIIRTSVDHGTALDLAGTGKADSGSLYVAIETARVMAANSRKPSPHISYSKVS